MESEPLNTTMDEQDAEFSQTLSIVNIKTEPEEEHEKNVNSCEFAMKGDVGDEALVQPVFVPIKAETDFEATLENSMVEEDAEKLQNTEDMEGCNHAVKEDLDESETLTEPLFVPIKVEPDFEGTLEDPIMEENFESAENAEDSPTLGTRFPESQSSEDKTYRSESGLRLKRQSVLNISERTNRTIGSFDNCKKSAAHFSCVAKVVKTGSLENIKRNFSCAACGKCFSSAVNLENHERTHTSEKPFPCLLCNETFMTKGELVVHMRVHSNERPYKCSFCGKSFKKTAHLKTHIRLHTGERPYKCNECGKAFNENSTLKSHIRSHKGEKPYKCTVCEKAFSRNSILTTHKRIHACEKRYKCQVCEMAFQQIGEVKIHMRIHTSEEPFRCQVCGNEFPSSSGLTRHMHIHAGEHTFACKDCESCFTHLTHLRRHRRQVHPASFVVPEGINN